MSASASTCDFWKFSLDVYGRAGVSPALIALQDQRGTDVNLLLLCCWVAATGRGRLASDDFLRFDTAIEPWREAVTLPLRRIRDRIKATDSLWTQNGAADVRGKVLAAEIESERICQERLEQLSPGSRRAHGNRDDARASIEIYFAFLGVEIENADREAIALLLDGTFP